MSQNSLTLPTTGTVSGLQMTQAINNALDTLNTLASGASAPGSPEAGQLWHDTTNNLLKIRSLDNTTWITMGQLNESSYIFAPPNTPTGTNDRANRLINGGMTFDRINSGSSYSVPNNNTPTYSAEQWVVSCGCSGASGVTAQQVSDAPAGFLNSLKVTVGTGGTVGVTDFLYAYQPIEANNLNDLNYGTANAQPTSLSFWVKSSIAGTFAAVLQNAAGNRACVNKFTIASPGVWQLVTIPNIPGDQSGSWATGNNAMLNLFIVIATGTTDQTTNLNTWQAGNFLGSTSQTNSVLSTNGATFQITGVQFNSGAFCMPFEKRPQSLEQLLCERYLPLIQADTNDYGTPFTGQCISTTGALVGWTFRVPARVKPTGLTASGSNHFGVTNASSARLTSTAISMNNGTVNGMLISVSVASGLVAGNATTLWSENVAAQMYATGCRM